MRQLREVKRLSQVTQFRLTPDELPDSAPSQVIVLSRFFATLASSAAAGFSSSWFRRQRLENNFQATAPLRCHSSGAPPKSMNICRTSLNVLLI